MNPKATSPLRNGNLRGLHCAVAPGPPEQAWPMVKVEILVRCPHPSRKAV
jgi:molybdopterin-biosynthesis enzyme MoeA-like protein